MKVSLETGIANVVLRQDNAVTLKQLHDAVTKNGFTMKTSVAIIAGTVEMSGTSTQLKVTGSNDLVTLEPENGAAPIQPSFNGKMVLVTGSLPEAPKGATPNTMKYRNIEVQQ